MSFTLQHLPEVYSTHPLFYHHTPPPCLHKVHTDASQSFVTTFAPFNIHTAYIRIQIHILCFPGCCGWFCNLTFKTIAQLHTDTHTHVNTRVSRVDLIFICKFNEGKTVLFMFRLYFAVNKFVCVCVSFSHSAHVCVCVCVYWNSSQPYCLPWLAACFSGSFNQQFSASNFVD